MLFERSLPRFSIIIILIYFFVKAGSSAKQKPVLRKEVLNSIMINIQQ